MQFSDRLEAGRQLARKLAHFRDRDDVIVLALPRGGVPVAFEVARSLHAPLDAFVVRKLGFPGHEEYAMGAIAPGGVLVMNPEIASFNVPQASIDEVVEREQAELERRERLYRGDRPPLALEDRVAILVDDGLATGSTMRAAAISAKRQRPQRVVVAAPVASRETCEAFRTEVDEIVCAYTPEPFQAVGIWYVDFAQTSDDEVRALLDAAAQWQSSPAREIAS